jgi:hypothetical protein
MDKELGIGHVLIAFSTIALVVIEIIFVGWMML